MVEKLDMDEIDSQRTPRYLIVIPTSIGIECISVFESVGKR